MGKSRPSSGEILFDGARYRYLTVAGARRPGPRMVDQRNLLCSRTTVAENLLVFENHPRRSLVIRKGRMAEKASRFLDGLGVSIDPRKSVDELTASGRALVGILVHVLPSPKALILDEALEKLSSEDFSKAKGILGALSASGTSILLITQRIDCLHALADRICILKEGGAPVREGRRDRQDQHPEDDPYSGGRAGEFDRVQRGLLRAPEIPQGGPAEAARGAPRRGQGGGPPNVLPPLPRLTGPAGRGGYLGPADYGRRLQDRRAHGRDGTTEKESPREHLELSEKLASIGLPAAGVAHEINNPLEILKNDVNLVRLYGQDRQTNELLDELDVELRSIKQITENLIAFSDDGDGRLEEVDLGGIVMGFVKLIKQNAEERGIAIAYSAALGGAVAVRANRGEMRQVPLNLYRNGYEAMPDGGSIRITLEKAFSKGAEAARPGFRDSGPGIEAENTRDLYGIVKKLGGTMRL